MTSQAHSSSIPEQLGNIPMREDQQNVERIILHRIDKDVDLSLVLPWLWMVDSGKLKRTDWLELRAN